MKTQMRFQKILTLVSLIIAALTFVYAISFFTGSLNELSYYTSVKSGSDPINCDGVYTAAQDANNIMFALSIVFIVAVCFLYITACNKRRKYYITNYIAIIAVAVFALVFAIVSIALISSVLTQFQNDIDWEAYKELHALTTSAGNKLNPHYSDSTTMFALGYVVFVVVIVDAVALVLNLIWKIKLMKGEKKLLENGLVKEVA